MLKNVGDLNGTTIAACPAGDSVYLDPNDQQPITCNEALQNSCPPNYHCTYNSLMNNYVCCGAGSMGKFVQNPSAYWSRKKVAFFSWTERGFTETFTGVCPNGEKAYMNAYDSSARECVINVEGSCPDKYLCRFNMQKNRYYCCTSVEGSKF